MIDSDHSNQFRQSIFIKNVPKFFSARQQIAQQKIFETVHFDANTYLFILQNRSHVNTNSCSAVTYTDYCQLGGRDFKKGIVTCKHYFV